MSKISKRISVMIICALLIFGSARRAEAAAEAGALSILGGSVAAGGIGAAIAAIAPPAIIIVGIALAAQGIYVSISEESEKLGMTKSDYIGTRLAQFALESGKQYSDVCHDIVDGSSVTESGSIALTASASKTIYQFINGLVANDEISAPVVSEGSYVSINGELCPVLEYNEFCEVLKFSSAPMTITNMTPDSKAVLFLQEVASGYNIGVIADKQIMGWSYGFTGYSGSYGSGGSNLTAANGLYYGSTSVPWSTVNTSETYIPIINLDGNDLRDVALSMNGNFDIVSGEENSANDTFVSASTVDTSVLNPAEGDVVVLNPGLDIPAIENEYGKAGTISIDNYLETLTRAVNGVEANTITISNALTGVLDTVAVGTYNPVGSATVAQEAEEDLPRVMTPVIDLTLNPTGSAAEKDLQGLAFDLTSVFPFCIPFDLFALIEKFDVQPETPRILVSLPLPGVGETLDLDLDLSPFETVAVILRSMELIAFIVGLALVTRNLIRG